MKKLLTVLLIVLGMVAMYGQENYKALSDEETVSASDSFRELFMVFSKDVATVTVQVFVDSVSGTPSGTATLYSSLDNTNWISETSVTWTSGVDTNFVLTDTTFYGLYGKLEVVTTGTTQSSKVSSYKMQWNAK